MTCPELVTERHGAAGAGPGGDLDIPARDVVPDGVVDQVGGQLLDQKRVTVEDGGLDIGADVQAEAVIAGRAAARASLVMAARSTDRARRGRCRRPGWHRLDEAFLLGVGGEQVLADGLPGGGGGGGVSEGDLEQGVFPGLGGWRSSREALAAKRRWASREASAAGEQVVEGVGEFLELVVGSWQRKALVQMVADGGRRR